MTISRLPIPPGMSVLPGTGLLVPSAGLGNAFSGLSTLDDLFSSLSTPTARTVETALAGYDGFVDERTQDHLYNNVLVPGERAFDDAFMAELSNSLGADDTVHLEGREKQIRKALVVGMKAYFAKVQPSYLKGFDVLELNDDLDAQYEILSRFFDEHVGVRKFGERVGTIKAFEGMAKTATLGGLKRAVRDRNSQVITRAVPSVLKDSYIERSFSGFGPLEIATYLYPQFKGINPKIVQDKVKYLSQPLNELLDLREKYLNFRLQ